MDRKKLLECFLTRFTFLTLVLKHSFSIIRICSYDVGKDVQAFFVGGGGLVKGSISKVWGVKRSILEKLYL